LIFVLRLPAPRGNVSELLLSELTGDVRRLESPALACCADPLRDEDLQLSLYLCYELHYRGLPDVDERWEWEPSLLAVRRELEVEFERALREAVAAPDVAPPPERMDVALRAVAESDEGPSLSGHLEREGTA
jgi:hypothetical protein